MTRDLYQIFHLPDPLTPLQQQRLETLQKGFLHLATVLQDNTPTVPEQRRALEALAEAYRLAQEAARRPRSILDPESLSSKVFRTIERQDTTVVRVWLNAYDFADVLKFGKEILERESDGAKLRQGIYGRIWGAEIRVARKIPVGYAMVISARDDDSDLKPDWVPDPTKLITL